MDGFKFNDNNERKTNRWLEEPKQNHANYCEENTIMPQQDGFCGASETNLRLSMNILNVY